MLASTKVMDALRGIDLNLYERRLWVAILARGSSTAGELAGIADVPRSRAYDVLQTLANKGFVIVQTGKPIRYVAVSPEEALEKAKVKMEENLRESMERIDEMKASPVVRELNDIFTHGMKMVSPEELTGALHGKYSLHQQLGTMFKNANKQIEIATTPKGLNEILSNHLDSLKKAKERGVAIKILTTGKEGAAEALKTLGSIADIRSADEKEAEVAGRFYVVDGKQFVLSLTDTDAHATQDMALWSKSEHASSDVLSPLFKLAWNKSKPLS